MAATLRERYITDDDISNSIYGDHLSAQSFLVGNTSANEDFVITSVKVKVYRNGTGGDPVDFVLRAIDGAGKPTGPDLSTGQQDPSGWTLSTLGAWEEITMSEFTCLASTQYVLVAKAPGSSWPNITYWRMDAEDATYTGGTAVYSTNGGSSWEVWPVHDMMFEIWGEEPPPPVEELSGVIEITSSTGGILEVTKTFVGEIVSTCAFTGILSRIGIEELIGEIVIQSTLPAAELSVFGELKGEIIINSYVTGRLFAPTVGGFSIYAKNKILEHLVGKTVYTMPACFIGLSTADPKDDASGLAEPVEKGYERIATTAANWSAAVAGKLTNTVELKSEKATAPWETITHWALFDALTGGNMLSFGKMKVPWMVYTNDRAKFREDYLSLKLD